MNRISVERDDNEFTHYFLKAVPVVDKNTGRLTITDGRVTIVFNCNMWKSFLVEPLTEEQLKQLAAQREAAQGEAKVE